jgi:hypothetical protein
MKRLLRIFALLTAASMLIWMFGCGGDDDDDDDNDLEPAQFASSSVTAGASVAANTSVIITLNRTVTEGEISIPGATGTTTAAGKTLTFTGTLPTGSATIASVTADGEAVEGFAPITFTVTAPDTTPPAISGAACVPADGATGVDPASVEDIVIKCSEALGDATVTSFEPEANVDASVDGDTVTINFLGGFSLGNEQEVVVELTITDLAANEAAVTYSFTTMAKEQ